MFLLSRARGGQTDFESGAFQNLLRTSHLDGLGPITYFTETLGGVTVVLHA